MNIAEILKNMSPKEIEASFKNRTRREVENMFYEELKRWHEKETRQEIVIARVQKRKPKLYKLIPYPLMILKMKAMNIAELEWFYSYCKESKHFVKCWYFNLKTK